MEAPTGNPAEEIASLQSCLNDLVSVLALPTVWSGRQPSQIVETLLDALFSMLRLDVVYVRFTDSIGGAPIEMLRREAQQHTARSEQICGKLSQLLSDDPKAWPALGTIRIDDQNISVVPLRLGIHGEIGVMVAGSQRTNFPRQTESLLLGVAANQASIALQDSRLLSEQKRVATELDERVEERTAELAVTNEELRKEIAERKRTEAALAASERKLRQVIDTIPTLAWCNLPDGPNEFLNKGWLEYTGLSPEESHDWGWQVAFHPEDLPELMERWRGMLVSGEPGEMEARLRRRDGLYRWFLIRCEPFRDESGTIVRWYGTSTDIDDRKRAEEKLRRTEAFLAEAQRLSLTGSFSWRATTDEITWSEQLYHIYELEVGVPVTLELIRTRVHPDDLTLYEKMVEEARSGGETFEWQYRLLMPDRSIKYLHAVAHATRAPDGQLEYIAAIQDVTARRLSEEARDKARSELAHVARVMSLGALTASIAHEVNQPLSGIVTNASTCLRMLSADPPNLEGARETARRTIRDGNRASDVITRLRALFSKKDTSPETVDLNDAAQEVIALSLSDLRRNRVVLRCELAHNIPAITGDRVQLQQVILNLLRNAAEAMSTVNDRPRELLIRTQADENGQVRLSVKDMGTGFNPQAIDGLFDAFYTTKRGGMGIGLSVSRSIVESHHGRLWASLNEGHGATFSLSIPCANGRSPVGESGRPVSAAPEPA